MPNKQRHSKQKQARTERPYYKTCHKSHGGYWMLGGLAILSIILGILMFMNYVHSVKFINQSLQSRANEAAALTIQQCADENMQWAKTCHAMGDLCEDTVPRMIKICLVSAKDTEAQCAAYGKDIYGDNFGLAQCQPYLKNREWKHACGDTWQAIADYCKAVAKARGFK